MFENTMYGFNLLAALDRCIFHSCALYSSTLYSSALHGYTFQGDLAGFFPVKCSVT